MTTVEAPYYSEYDRTLQNACIQVDSDLSDALAALCDGRGPIVAKGYFLRAQNHAATYGLRFNFRTFENWREFEYLFHWHEEV